MFPSSKLRPFPRLDWGSAFRHSPEKREAYGPLFDVRFYLSQVVGLRTRDAVAHYEEIGAKQGLSPVPLFSDGHYRSQFPDEEIENPILHYRTVGVAKGSSPHPLFQPEWYLQRVQEADCIDSREGCKDPLSHFMAWGWRAGLSPHPLVCLPYASRYVPIIRRSGQDPLTYLIRRGMSKYRRPHPLYSPDQLWTSLKLKGLKVTQENQIERFANWDETFSPSPFFWEAFYKNEYPESDAYPGGPWNHFVQIGQFQDGDPNPYFNSAWYRKKYGGTLEGTSPFLHYLTHEQSQRYQPSPEFDTAHYLKTNPQVLKTGRSPLEHFLEYGRHASAEIQPFITPPYLVRQLSEAAKLEPELDFSGEIIDALPVYNRHQSVRIASQYEVLKSLVHQPFQTLVTVPFLSRGGADLAACNLVRQLQQTRGLENVFVVLTDGPEMKSLDWMPKGTRWACFSHVSKKLGENDRIKLLQLLIEDFRPSECYNVNSLACWQLISRSGLGLTQICRLYAQLFCHDYDNNLCPKGYAVDFLPKTLKHFHGIFFDSRYFQSHIAETVEAASLEREKLSTLYQPYKPFGNSSTMMERLERLQRGGEYRRQVMWAGRLDRQKQPEILAEVARQCPKCDFHVFGTPVLNRNRSGPDFGSNVTVHGEYAEFFDLPLASMDVFLHTSAWDGLPLVLIDAAQTGLPIVTSQVGGIPELVDEETGWPVTHHENASEYAERLRQICSSRTDIASKLEKGLARVETQHNWQQYVETLTHFQRYDGSPAASGQIAGTERAS